MKTLTLQIPDSVDEKEMKMKLAAYWFQSGAMFLAQILLPK